MCSKDYFEKYAFLSAVFSRKSVIVIILINMYIQVTNGLDIKHGVIETSSYVASDVDKGIRESVTKSQEAFTLNVSEIDSHATSEIEANGNKQDIYEYLEIGTTNSMLNMKRQNRPSLERETNSKNSSEVNAAENKSDNGEFNQINSHFRSVFDYNDLTNPQLSTSEVPMINTPYSNASENVPTRQTRSEKHDARYSWDLEFDGLDPDLKDSNKSVLYIGGMFPMSGSWAGGQGCRPAVNLALSDVNAREDILPDYHLQMISSNSKCEPGLGVKILYELLYNEPKKLLLLGPGCSQVSTFVAEAAGLWNLILLSYGSSSPALSDRHRFPTFFRTHPSATFHNPCRVKLFKKYGWKRISTIVETQEVWTSTMSDLEDRVQNAGIEIIARSSFLTDPSDAVSNLKRQDSRIIVGLFYENMARRVFCEVYKQKLFGPKYVWFLIGWYKDNWFLENDTSIDCTPEQMLKAVEGHFTTEGIMLNPDDVTTFSGLTASEFTKLLDKQIEHDTPSSLTGYVEAPLAYDAVWALALMLNETQNRLAARNKSLLIYDYSNVDLMKEMYSIMNSTDFIGVSGRVLFNAAGDRILGSQVEQMIDGNYTVVGYYDSASDNFERWFGIDHWIDGKVPQDSTFIIQKPVTVNKYILMSLSMISLGCIIIATILMVINIVFRNNRYIINSHPNINNLMLLGSILCLGCIALEASERYFQSEKQYQYFCQIRCWTFSIGFVLLFSPMLCKVFTIYRISSRTKKELKEFKTWEMYLTIVSILSANLIILTLWTIFDPLRRDSEFFARQTPSNSSLDIEIQPVLSYCNCKHFEIWLGVILGYKVVLLLCGLILAYETRNLKVDKIDDSSFIAIAIYNIVVLSCISVPVRMLIGSHKSAAFTWMSAAVVVTCVISIGLCFVPKIKELFITKKKKVPTATLR